MQKTKLLLNILAFFLCALPAIAVAQGGGNVTVRGIVTSADDKQPLIGVDTEFNVEDSVCYLSGDNIIHTSISKIIIEISYTDDSFLMVYKLSDGLSVPRNNYPQWGKRLFRDKDSLMRYLSES